MSAVKRTRINERWNVELRTEFLNALNHVNFMVGGAGFGHWAATEPRGTSEHTAS